jgi:hypothetical protein
MHKSTTKCNETIGKWCKNKHGASKIIDTFETYQDAKERGVEAQEERRAPGSSVVCPPPPLGVPLYRGKETSLPLHQVRWD